MLYGLSCFLVPQHTQLHNELAELLYIEPKANIADHSHFNHFLYHKLLRRDKPREKPDFDCLATRIVEISLDTPFQTPDLSYRQRQPFDIIFNL